MDDKQRRLCEEVWLRYHRPLENFCRKRLKSMTQEVEDVVAELSFLFCDAVAGNKIHTSEKAWLFGTAQKLIYKKYKEKIRETVLLSKYSASQIPILSSLNLDDIVLNRLFTEETIELIKDDIIEALSIKEKELYILVYNKNKSYREISALLGITVNAAKQRKYRLDKKLAGIFSRYAEQMIIPEELKT